MNEPLPFKIRDYDRHLFRGRDARIAQRADLAVPQCLFCDASNARSTREHVIPEWLQEYLGAQDQVVAPSRYQFRTDTFHDVRRKHLLSSVTCGEVCGDCNNGWMSELECRVEPTLKALIEGRRCDSTVKYDLCRWVAKTAVVLNYSMPYRLLWDPHSRHAIRTGLPPNTWYGMARSRTSDPAVDWSQGAPVEISVGSGLSQSEAEEFVESAHFLGLRLGRLVLRLIHDQGDYLFDVKGRFLAMDAQSRHPLKPLDAPRAGEHAVANPVHIRRLRRRFR